MMISLLKVVLVVGAAWLTTLVPSCMVVDQGTTRFQQTRNISVPHVPTSAVDVSTINGSVTLKKGPGPDVAIEAKLGSRSQERLDAARVVTDRVDGTLKVTVDWPDGKTQTGDSCSFNITLPDAGGVTVHTTNGAIDTGGLGGTAVLRTTNGAITVTGHDGPVDGRSTNGRIRIESASGELVAHTTNGTIEITGATKQVGAESTNGRVRITLADECPGPLHVKTTNGGVDLTLGRAFEGQLNLSTSNGSVDAAGISGAQQTTLRKTSGNIVFAQGDAVSDVRTTNASIHVRTAAQ